MKIRTRLSLLFSLITSAVFIAFGCTVYLFSENHRSEDFQDHLEKRVVITEKIFLEKESFSAIELDKITDQFLHTLSEETEEVVEIKAGLKLKFKHDYPEDFLQNYSSFDVIKYDDNSREGRCRIFDVKGKKYLIIVTAVDVVGIKNLSFLKRVILLLVLIGIPFIFLVSFIFTKRELRPLFQKIENANRIGASNLHERLSVYNPNDEIGQMATAFNSLLDRLETAFEAQKSFISNAAHEIKNPLTAIMGEAEVVLSKERVGSEYVSALKIVLLESERLDNTVNNLLQLSKVLTQDEDIRYDKLKLQDFVFEVKSSFDFINPDNEILIDDSGTELMILGNKNLLKTVLINLFDNACKFSNNGIVNVRFEELKDMNVLCIKDEGIGILDGDLDKITMPFYRGENALKMNGSGIGLSLISIIMKLHCGEIKIVSEVGIGTEVKVYFKKEGK
jgi:signal transduction histidine kinase